MKKPFLVLSVCILIVCSIVIISNKNIKIAYGEHTDHQADENSVATTIAITSNKTEIINNGTDTV